MDQIKSEGPQCDPPNVRSVITAVVTSLPETPTPYKKKKNWTVTANYLGGMVYTVRSYLSDTIGGEVQIGHLTGKKWSIKLEHFSGKAKAECKKA